MSNRCSFRSIARLAEKLKVSLRVASTLREGHNVIELKPFLRSALDASTFVATPDGMLHGFGNALAAQWLIPERLKTLRKL